MARQHKGPFKFTAADRPRPLNPVTKAWTAFWEALWGTASTGKALVIEGADVMPPSVYTKARDRGLAARTRHQDGRLYAWAERVRTGARGVKARGRRKR